MVPASPNFICYFLWEQYRRAEVWMAYICLCSVFSLHYFLSPIFSFSFRHVCLLYIILLWWQHWQYHIDWILFVFQHEVNNILLQLRSLFIKFNRCFPMCMPAIYIYIYMWRCMRKPGTSRGLKIKLFEIFQICFLCLINEDQKCIEIIISQFVKFQT